MASSLEALREITTWHPAWRHKGMTWYPAWRVEARSEAEGERGEWAFMGGCGGEGGSAYICAEAHSGNQVLCNRLTWSSDPSNQAR